MNRAVRFAVAIAVVVAGVVESGGNAPAGPRPRSGGTPPWVLHTQRYPGGLSQGVRARVARGLAAPPGAGSATLAPQAGSGNVQMNADSSPKQPQDEPSVAFDVFHPLRAVAASNDYVKNGMWIGHTSDGGQTWGSRFKVPRLSDGRQCFGSDPSVVYSRRDHAFYVSTLCFTNGPHSEIDVWKSVDDGATWTPSGRAAVIASNLQSNGSANALVFYDKELLAVDNSPTSRHYGRLYATYIRFHMRPDGFSDTCPVRLAYTDRVPTRDPSRATWRHVSVVPGHIGAGGTGSSANQWATPVVDERGALDVAYVTENCNSGIDSGLYFKRSTNGGRSFGGRVRIDKPGQFADNPDPDDRLAPKHAPIGLSPSLAVNRVTGSLNYVFQNNVNAGSSGADISYVQSTDHGRTWSDAVPLSVTDTGDPAPQDQFFPWIAAEGNGTLQAVWLDNRNDSQNLEIETFQATSTDDGATWSFQDISTTPWDPNESFFCSGDFIGDYSGIAATRKVVYPVWTDGRNTPHGQGSCLGDTDIFTNVELPGP
jgi:hypothetical protein